MKIGTQDISAYYFGNSLVSKLYKGTHLVWEASGPEPGRVLNIKCDQSGFTNSLEGWNWWPEDSDMVLLTDDGNPTDIKLISGGANWSRDNMDDMVLSNEFFPEGVFKSIVYTDQFAANPKLLTLTGLNPSKLYDIRFAVAYKYYDPQDATNVTVNGVTQFLDGVNENTLYMVEFLNQTASPAGEIPMSVAPAGDVQYGILCAIKIIEKNL